MSSKSKRNSLTKTSSQRSKCLMPRIPEKSGKLILNNYISRKGEECSDERATQMIKEVDSDYSELKICSDTDNRAYESDDRQEITYGTIFI